MAGTLAANSIQGWEHQYAFRTGKLTQTDYNFETPATSLLADATAASLFSTHKVV